jgi:acetyl-CoA acetyltransferase family protein
VTVDVPQPKGDPVTIHADEGPRPDTSLEQLARLRPIFRDGGTVTAGNASQINDGAAAVVVASDERARELGREPLARIVSSASAGVDPAVMGIGPLPATRKALERAGLEPKDIDLVELNEAFASQVLASMRELGFDHERLNVNCGAIALGHPLGCSGARLIGTLAHELRRRGARYGVATMCIGVGMGMAAVIENPAA